MVSASGALFQLDILTGTKDKKFGSSSPDELDEPNERANVCSFTARKPDRMGSIRRSPHRRTLESGCCC